MDWDSYDDYENRYSHKSTHACPACHSRQSVQVQTDFGYQVACQSCGAAGPRATHPSVALDRWNSLPRTTLQAEDRRKLNDCLDLVEKTLTPKRRRKKTPQP